MDETRLKEVLEVMLMNEAPMQLITCVSLEQIRDGRIPYISEREGKRYESSQLLAIIREGETMHDTYNKIDISKLDEETGRAIVEECQGLLREFHDQYFVLLNRYIENDFQAQEVPQRLFEIRDRVLALADEYGNLKAYKLYDKAWLVGYFSHESKTRRQWFIDGKPTEVHPEKLELILREI